MELIPRFHQELFVKKTIDKIKEGKNNFLWGWKCRAGKTYGVGHLIDIYYKNFEMINAIIITPAPSETLTQFSNEMFNKFINFRHLNIIEIKKGTDLNNITNNTNNVIIISKQLLDNYVKNKTKNNFHKQIFDLVIFDENHFGGTTNNAKEILSLFNSNFSNYIYLTATYQKTLKQFDIDSECQFFWTIEDEMYCKNRDINKLKIKHGIDVNYFLDESNLNDKLKFYDNMPNMHLISTLLDQDKFEVIKDRLDNSDDGFSMDVLFSLHKESKTFLFKDQVKELLNYISGTNKTCIYNRIIQSSKKYNSRTLLNNENFSTQLWFLPFGIGLKIDDLSKNLKNIMLEFDEFNEYEIMIINSKIKEIKNLKEHIFKTENKAKLNKKKGLILLAGNQCSLGITLPLVDVVFLLNNITSSDKIMQMMYRCMSETSDGSKKNGYVIDFNINRVLHTFIDYPIIETNLLTHQKIEYVIQNNLINLDTDIFESKQNKGELIDKLLKIWRNDPENEHRLLFKKIQNLNINIDEKDQNIMNKYFTSLGNDIDEHFVRFDDEIYQTLPKGRKKMPLLNFDESQEVNESNVEDLHVDDEKELNISFQEDILPLIIPLFALMNYDQNNNNIKDCLIYIDNSEYLKEVINDYMFMLWEKKDLFKMIYHLTNKFLIDNKEINNILYQFRMVYNSLINEPNELLDYLKKSLKPKELEKKKFGEVFTPMELIDEMMDKLDIHYKKEHKKSIFSESSFKWYDPSAGMGSFPVNVYYRLMNGLKKEFPDENKRKKHILEKMLYMSEINKKNCYVLEKLFNKKKFNLNIYCGDSLKIDISKKFNVEKFDVIMGNPPFQEKNKSGDNKKYLEFTKLSLQQLGISKYLLFITPRNIIDYLLLHEKNRKYIDKLYNINHISIETCSKYFNVGSSFLWFILQNKDYINNTEIDFLDYTNKIKTTFIKLYPAINLPRYPNEIDLNIIKKLTNNKNKFKVKDIKFNNKSQRIRKEMINKGIVKENKNNDFKYKIIDTINKTNPFPPKKYYFYNKKDDDYDKDKIVISKKGYLMPYIDNTHDYTYSDNFKIIVDNKKNLKNILKIIDSCLVKYLIKQFSKHGFDNINALELLNEKIDDDKDIYKLYNLTENEKNHINYITNC
jgi:hypothetical protein